MHMRIMHYAQMHYPSMHLKCISNALGNNAYENSALWSGALWAWCISIAFKMHLKRSTSSTELNWLTQRDIEISNAFQMHSQMHFKCIIFLRCILNAFQTSQMHLNIMHYPQMHFKCISNALSPYAYENNALFSYALFSYAFEMHLRCIWE